MPITKSQAERESKRLKVSTDHKIVTFNGHDLIQEGWNQLKQDKREATLSEELLLYHHRLGHTGFDKLREMARQGVIPTYLAKAPAPRCMACMYSKATRRQWRNKQQEGWTRTAAAQYPGHIVSVDQLVSPTPGLIAQMTGRLMKAKYKVATVYVDQYSSFGYVHLQKSNGIEETLASKTAFEVICKQHGVSIEGYHADNGVFCAHQWMDECRRRRQNLSFAGVGAHHTNAKVERRIRYLQDRARSMLIHAQKKWGLAGMVHLWPYAVRLANDAINESANMQDVEKYSPLQIFAGTEVNVNCKHWKPFGCPVYVP